LVFAETYTTYASDIQYYRDGESQGGDPYAAIADMKLKTYYDLAVTWSHPLETVERTYHTDTETLNGSSLWLGTRKSYAYDPADQNGSQFGNLTGVTAYDWDGSAWQAHSLSKTIYYPNVSAGSYLTGLPATMETYGCLNQDCSSSSLQAATRYLYDQQSNYLTSPTQGILTTQRVLLDNPGSGNQYQDTAYQYDAYGNLVRQEQFFQEGTETVLASGDAMTTETCYGAAVSAICCAAASSGDIALPLWQQQWTSAVDVLRTEWTYDYGLGLVLSETLPNEGETYAQYDQFGRITSLIRPGDTSDSPSMRFRYYAEIPYRTEVDQMISAYQATTYRKLYDGRGNLLQTQTLNQTLEDGACDSVDGELDTCQTVVDYFHGYVSDAGQLRWQEKQTAPYVISTDPGGYLSPQPSAQQYWSSTRMDILGRTALITAADGTWQSYSYGIAWEDLLEKVAVNQYQPVANLLYRTTLSETNTINNQVQTIVSHSYQDAFGQTHLSQAALPPYTYYNYDVRGNLVQALQWDATTYQSGTPAYADAIISEISYDLGGRKTGMQDADMGNWVYEYDAPSNLLRQTDAKAQTTCLYYDLLGRLLGKNYQSNATCPGSASTYTVAYGYDAADEDNNGQGQRTSMQDLSGSTTWEFDLRGRVIHEQKTIQDPIGSLDLGTYHTWYAYHADDSLSQMVLPNQETLDYSYYTAGGLQGVSTLESDANGDHQRYHYTDQISYDEAGRLTGRTFGNGVLQTYAYYAWDNQGGRLSTVTAQNSSASSIQNLSYGNDEQGNITSLVDAVASENFAYQYDLLNRLTAVTGSLSQSTSYSNLTGNILQKDGVSYGYDPNHPHAITTLNSVSKYTYDANGSMTSRVVDGTQYNLGYDEENRLVTLSGGSLTARYVYDGDGRRVLAVVGDTRTLFVSSAFEVSITGTPPTFSDPPLENYPLCHYLYCFFMPLLLGGADSEVLGMQSGNFGNTRYHTHPLEPLATSLTWQVYYPGGGLRVQTSSSNTLTYLLTDHLNSTTTTLDTDGDITAWLRYDAWGVTRSSSGTTPTSKNYTGQYQAEAGLYFYNARWYDPETGRFAQADTIIPEAGDPLAWDRYAYVKNNPIKHCDTSGHCIDGLTTIPCLVALIAVAGFSGGSAIYQFNVSGNSWWESTEDAIATAKAGVEGMFLVVGAALTAGQVALLAPDAAMWLGANTNNTGLFSWGVNQAGLVQQTNTITNKIPNNKKVVTIQSRKNSYTNESKIPPPLEFPKAPYGFQGTYQSPYGFPVDPKSPPTPDFVWRGKGVPGSIEGNWTKPTTGEWLHWDPFHHRTSHYDYGAADGTIYRIWPDGTMSPK
jgi:RHS repeat-associated protein